MDSCYELRIAATREIGAPDASSEKHVARKHNSGTRYVINQRTGRMSRHVKRLYLIFSQGKHLTLINEAVHLKWSGICRHMKHRGLLTALTAKRRIGFIAKHWHSILPADMLRTEGVVDMKVCEQHSLKVQCMLGDEVVDIATFCLSVHSRVDNCCLKGGIVPYYICFFSKEVYLKRLLFYHISALQWFVNQFFRSKERLAEVIRQWYLNCASGSGFYFIGQISTL